MMMIDDNAVHDTQDEGLDTYTEPENYPQDNTEERIAILERQVSELAQNASIQRQRQQQTMAEFMELLGATLINHSRGIKRQIVYPTTVRSVPDEEAGNEGTLYLTLREGEPCLYKEGSDGFTPITIEGVDAAALREYLDTKETFSGGMFKVNVYLER